MEESGGTPRGEAPKGHVPEAHRDQEVMRRLQRARRARVAKALVIVAIVVLLIVFVIQNSGPVEVDFVFVTREPRLIWVLVVTAMLGAIVGYLLGRPSKQPDAGRKSKQAPRGR